MMPEPTSDLARAEADLCQHGYCLVAHALDPVEVAARRDAVDRSARADFEAGRAYVDSAGNNQRLWQLLNRGPEFVALAEHPLALRLATALLGEVTAFRGRGDGLPQFQLSSITANIAGPGGHKMILHADQGFHPEPWPAHPVVCNGGWLLDDFTAENGATLVVPGSHRSNHNPRYADAEQAVPIVGPAGTLFFFDGRLWHGTGENRTDQLRRAVFTYYCQPWIRTQEAHVASLDPDVVDSASPLLRRLTGFDRYGETLGMIDGLPPRTDVDPAPHLPPR
ncbi:MAG: phytanoyl-CoA dioxygenase family protein [Actinomycetota bacterium]